MKRWLSILFIAFTLGACATGGSMSSSGSSTTSVSPESKAREITNRMRTVLELNKTQEEKVLSINLVHQKLLQRSRENNDQNLANSTRENYHKELKAVFTEAQFSKFRQSFPEL
jgi:hypothetical protein